MCKFESGLTSKKCKLFLGRDKHWLSHIAAHLQACTSKTLKPKTFKRAAIYLPALTYIPEFHCLIFV